MCKVSVLEKHTWDQNRLFLHTWQVVLDCVLMTVDFYNHIHNKKNSKAKKVNPCLRWWNSMYLVEVNIEVLCE